ncbi:MAG: fucose isomerase [Acidobacteriaceae bacterium]
MPAPSQSPVYLIASGDLRLSANQLCWQAQKNMEDALTQAINSLGREVIRTHPYDLWKRHGFLDGQRYGMEVLAKVPKDAPLMVAEAVWQYTHHVLAGLTNHHGPILTVANWSGQWPGLVGLLNLNGSLTKAGVSYSSLWSVDFRDAFFLDNLKSWLQQGTLQHDLSHVQPFQPDVVSAYAHSLGSAIAQQLLERQAILDVFDEGCMGMYNAIVPDELMHKMGIFKERLSQSSLYYEVMQTSDEEARAVYDWLLKKGMRFELGSDEEVPLTEKQVLAQCKMYISALRIADDFGCDAISIQYPQGLKDILPASDLAEGLLNNVERPPVKDRSGSRILFEGAALPHFSEVDECAGIDALITNRIWKALGMAPETTLHDLRYGEEYGGEFVWAVEISGAAPPAHFIDGYRGAVSQRQPPMYFRLGGGSLKGISKPGEIVWSRIFVEQGRLKADLGRARAVELPREEVERRWNITTPQWPIMNVVLSGVTRDQMMARHKANHIQVTYAENAQQADEALAAKCYCFHALGIDVFTCGTSSK